MLRSLSLSLVFLLGLSACNKGGSAMDTLCDCQASPVAEDAVSDDGYILNRLNALIAEGASPRDLEKALAKVDGTIASSRPGLAWITVDIPQVADLAALEEVAATLADTDGILLAFPGELVRDPQPVESLSEESPPPVAPPPYTPASDWRGNTALGSQRFLTAWHAQALATERTRVYVVDGFASYTVPAQLPGMRFSGVIPDGTFMVNSDGYTEGNHGFWVASLLGATSDETLPSGTHPDAASTLELVALNRNRMGTFLDVMLMVDRELTDNEPAVLNFSLGFTQIPDFRTRYLYALAWRELMLQRTVIPFVVMSSGNEHSTSRKLTQLNSPMGVEAYVDDLDALSTGSDEELRMAIADAALRSGNRVYARVGTALLVGSSNPSGETSVFSNEPSDVRMVGEQLLGVCGVTDPPCPSGSKTCDSTTQCDSKLLMIADGTSGAAPQAAGLAAWLLSLDPTLTAPELYGLLMQSFDGRWVDALSATLALEARGIPVRQALLDQDADGDFDQEDIASALADIATAMIEDPEPSKDSRTWTQADLNGDGWPNSDTEMAVDLDGDGLIGAASFEIPGTEASLTETVTIQESAISDLDFLCWGAYAGPYSQDSEAQDERDELLAGECGGDAPSMVILTIISQADSSIFVPTYWSGQTSDGVEYFEQKMEGEMVADDELIYTSTPPEGGWTLPDFLGTNAFGKLPCDSFEGDCADGSDFSYDGDAASLSTWDCDDDLGVREATCTIRAEGTASAAVPDGQSDLSSSGTATGAYTDWIMWFRVDAPTHYQLGTGTWSLPDPTGNPTEFSYTEQHSYVELEGWTREGPDDPLEGGPIVQRGRYTTFDTTDAPGGTIGATSGTLPVGVYRLRVFVLVSILTDVDQELGVQAAMDGAMTFTPE